MIKSDRKINSRVKGKRGEREVAGLLRVWWNTVEECQFVSTPSSGGFGNAQVRGEFKIAGDLMTTAKQWPFTVEVKRREKWSMKTLEKGAPSPVWGWWAQVVKSAREERTASRVGGGEPMLWFRKSRGQWHLMLSAACAMGFQQFCSPTIRWAPELLALRGVEELPVLYMAEDLLLLDPALMLGLARS